MKPLLVRKKEIIYHFVCGKIIDGIPPGVRGNLTGVCGNLTNVRGDLTGVCGNLDGVGGNLTGVCGNLDGVCGNLDDCELTKSDRKRGVDIEQLIV